MFREFSIKAVGMRKKILLFAMVLFLFSAPAAAENGKEGKKDGRPVVRTVNEREYIVYDVYKHMETANNIYLGLGAVSLGAGIGMASTAGDNRLVTWAGLQNIFWGLAETGFAVYDKNWAERERDPATARQKFHDISGRNLVLDLVYITGGALLLGFGNEEIKGNGLGIMMQGAMLALFDAANFAITAGPENVNEWNAGWNVRVGMVIN